ncbi:hypothetical protein [Microbacterium sp. No. 7]|uniref:hypothetical protein n=1 Tax=Microbacterium sp. No. 7 TaxID=1714373 RepID=UPI0012E1F662|nr:hypothetical protein [Microbacterium sp. No. 7]
MTATDSFLESISPQQLFDDPYPIYERLRRDAPVAYPRSTDEPRAARAGVVGGR